MRYTPKEEIVGRISRLQGLLREHNVDGALIVQNADLFYFTGTVQRAHLFVPAEGKPVLMVRKDLDRARRESPLDHVVRLDNLRDLLPTLEAYGYGPPKRIGLELDVLPANLYFRYRELLAPARTVDVSPLIRTVRAVKSPYELDLLRAAAALNRILFDHVPQFLREGITEVELAGQLESIYRRHGHQGYVRMRGFNQELLYGHLLSGWAGGVPSFLDSPTGGTGLNPSFPQSAGRKPIGRNEPVLIDYVAVLDGYMVDQARTFCLGRLPEKLVRAYYASLEIQERLKGEARPGTTAGELYDLAVRLARATGFGDHFMGYPEPVPFVGHGLGIELDELPVLARGSKMTLQEGMVIALEPKFVFPEGAVGIENTFVVSTRGLEPLTLYEEHIIYL